MHPSSLSNPPGGGYFPGAGGIRAGPVGASGGAHYQADRRKQINTLRIFNENVTEVRPDVQYRVDFELSDGATGASLVVLLPPGFPRERPSITLGGSPGSPGGLPAGLSHPWLDPATGAVVGAPGLLQYSAHSDLGRVVQVIKREMAKTPLAASPNGPGNPRRVSLGAMPKANSTHALLPAKQRGGEPAPRFGTPPPNHPSQAAAASAAPNPKRQTYMSSLTGLNELSEEELREIASDDAAARAFCRRMKNPTGERHSRLIADTRAQVEELLRANGELEERIDAARASLLSRVEAANADKREAAALSARLAEFSSSRLAPDVLVDRLRIATSEAEEASEAVAEDFLAGGRDVDAFLRDYAAARTKVVARKARLDQFRKLKREGGRP